MKIKTPSASLGRWLVVISTFLWASSPRLLAVESLFSGVEGNWVATFEGSPGVQLARVSIWPSHVDGDPKREWLYAMINQDNKNIGQNLKMVIANQNAVNWNNTYRWKDTDFKMVNVRMNDGTADEMTGTWQTYTGVTGRAVFRRAIPRITRVAVWSQFGSTPRVPSWSARNHSVAYGAEPLRVEFDYREETWSLRNNKMRGNRPNILLRIYGENLWGVSRSEIADHPEFEFRLPTHWDDTYTTWLFDENGVHIGRQIQIHLWDGIKPGKYDINVNGVLVPIDLVLNGYPSEQLEDHVEATALRFTDLQGEEVKDANLGESVFVVLKFNRLSDDAPTVQLSHSGQERPLRLGVAEGLNWRSAPLKVGRDLPSVVGRPIKARNGDLAAEIVVESDEYVWTGKLDKNWSNAANWEDENGAAHTRAPGRSAADQVTIPSGEVILDQPATIGRLSSLGRLKIEHKLTANSGVVKTVEVHADFHVRDSLRVEGELAWISGDWTVDALLRIEAKGKAVVVPGEKPKNWILGQDATVLGDLVIGGRLHIAGTESVVLSNQGTTTFLEGAVISGANFRFSNRSRVEAYRSRLDVPMDTIAAGSFSIVGQLILAGGGVHDRLNFGDSGELVFDGEHVVEQSSQIAIAVTQAGGKIKLSDEMIFLGPVKLTNGVLSASSRLAFMGKLKQNEGHVINTAGGVGPFEIRNNSDAVFYGQLELTPSTPFQISTDGVAKFAGTSRKITIPGRFNNPGTLIVDAGITLALDDVVQRHPEAAVNESVTVQQRAQYEIGAGLCGGIWDIAGEVDFEQGAKPKRTMTAIGSGTEVILRGEGRLQTLNDGDSKSGKLWNTGSLELRDQVSLMLTEYYQRNTRSQLIVETGSMMQVYVMTGSPIRFAVPEGNVTFDGDLFAYDIIEVGSSDYVPDDRRIHFGSLARLSGAGKVNGKAVTAFDGKVTPAAKPVPAWDGK